VGGVSGDRSGVASARFRRRTAVAAAATALLLLLCALFAFPFLWMALATTKANPEIFDPVRLLPSELHLRHFRDLLSGMWIPYPRQYLNSLFIAAVQTLLALALAAPAGYLFAKHRFRGRAPLLMLAVLVVLVPRQVMVLPLFTWMNDLRLLDGPWAVIWPGAVSGIGILYFRQAWKRVPDELLDTARSEGASEYRAFLAALPLMKPALAAYGLIHFILAWHEHLIPLVMLSTPEHMTSGVALASLHGSHLRIPYGVIMAGALLTVFPTAVLYILVRKQFRSSLSEIVA
jgi:ABC-type glycerol-3-phosphate transport system permease component